MGVVGAFFLFLCVAGRTKTASIYTKGLKSVGEGQGPVRPLSPLSHSEYTLQQQPPQYSSPTSTVLTPEKGFIQIPESQTSQVVVSPPPTAINSKTHKSQTPVTPPGTLRPTTTEDFPPQEKNGSKTLDEQWRGKERGRSEKAGIRRAEEVPEWDRKEDQRRAAKTEHTLKNLRHYEVVVPSLVDHRGEFLSYDVTDKMHFTYNTRRMRRSTHYNDHHSNKIDQGYHGHEAEKSIYYSLSAYGKDFHFNLTLNTALVSPSYVLEYWSGSGNVWRRKSIARPCHYVGHLSSSRESRVALSNCIGLHGVFATKDEEYFVEPLWNDTHNIDIEGRFHIVYKRSALKTMFSESQCGVKDTTTTNQIPHWWLSRSPPIHNDVLKQINSRRHLDRWERRRRKRRSISTERNVETLVVVDKMMIGYHGNEEVEPYVLTVMNIVANLYHDASIGNAINIMVTRLVLLSKDQPNLQIDHHADRSLESFCRWQQTINPSQDSKNSRDQGVAHHDNAVLITRYDICTYKNEPCGTLGLAPVAGMCESDRSCSINEDIGLASAFTIAHEIGHNFGMQHDGAGNKCGKPGGEPAKIMAAQLTKNTEPFSWSSCSREYITGFLDSGRGKCLENPPPEQEFEFPTQLPGQIHDAKAQCEFQYGSQSRPCRLGEVCRELWCTNRNQKCVSNNIPAAEGTICSKKNNSDGWCYKGRCVRYGWTPPSVDGGWGVWSEWGSCSRTCDGGVESSERFCDSPRPKHGGKYCIGERKRYRSCNTIDCPINSTDFREIQCSAFNEVPFRGKYYKWKPFAGGISQVKPCALNCLAVGYNFYTERSPEVVDGTRCYPDSINMCINGECKHVGCDRVLGSDAVEDTCRVCGGDESTCETIQGVFDENLNLVEEAYREVVRIPQGAVHIRVAEKVFSRNYLALKSIDGEYYINGAWTIDWPRKFEVANTVFHYERLKDKPEIMTALGPISEDLLIMVLIQGENTGIEYQYNLAITNHSLNGTEFVWQYTPWSECSKSCAKGISQSVAVCVRKDDKTHVTKEYCVPHLRPNDRIKYCNEEACPPDWSIGDWSECSKTCGGGVKTRRVKCLRLVRDNITEVLHHRNCGKNRPRAQLRCNREKCPPHWATDGWSDCRPSCGPGEQTRNVYCVSAQGRYMESKHCNATTPPPKKRKCNDGACPPPAWTTDEWGECSAKCGIGQQHRTVSCKTYSGTPSEECSPSNVPPDIQQCEGSCEAETGDTECKDVNKVAYCPLVLKFRFCNRAYFRQMCCKTCSEAGF